MSEKRIMPEILDYYDKEVSILLMEKYGFSAMEALRLFTQSKTHEMIEYSKYAMWEFGPKGILDIWEAEKITGDPRNSIYIRGE